MRARKYFNLRFIVRRFDGEAAHDSNGELTMGRHLASLAASTSAVKGAEQVWQVTDLAKKLYAAGDPKATGEDALVISLEEHNLLVKVVDEADAVMPWFKRLAMESYKESLEIEVGETSEKDDVRRHLDMGKPEAPALAPATDVAP